jgi:hypothetical protein
MIPSIFISSTISDLQYLREAIRDTIKEIGYNPVLSDFGDIGYSPFTSAEDSCYLSLKDCQLAILIIGKKYGSLSQHANLSITQMEFRTAKDLKKPIVCLVDQEVISFKKSLTQTKQ